ncbi:MAG: hypothetical protein J7L55_02645, partial [Desulfurococcales archaeon]|nr:hypothetical protein [Desulfurococcales archaeon]
PQHTNIIRVALNGVKTELAAEAVVQGAANPRSVCIHGNLLLIATTVDMFAPPKPLPLPGWRFPAPPIIIPVIKEFTNLYIMNASNLLPTHVIREVAKGPATLLTCIGNYALIKAGWGKGTLIEVDLRNPKKPVEVKGFQGPTRITSALSVMSDYVVFAGLTQPPWFLGKPVVKMYKVSTSGALTLVSEANLTSGISEAFTSTLKYVREGSNAYLLTTTQGFGKGGRHWELTAMSISTEGLEQILTVTTPTQPEPLIKGNTLYVATQTHIEAYSLETGQKLSKTEIPQAPASAHQT